MYKFTLPIEKFIIFTVIEQSTLRRLLELFSNHLLTILKINVLTIKSEAHAVYMKIIETY